MTTTRRCEEEEEEEDVEMKRKRLEFKFLRRKEVAISRAETTAMMARYDGDKEEQGLCFFFVYLE